MKRKCGIYISKAMIRKIRPTMLGVFGGGPLMSNKLATFVLNGIKTVTASAYQLYELENIPLPPIGGLNIILYVDYNSVCIT